MRVVDILPKFPQYEDFPYAPDLDCPNCGKSGFYDSDWGPKHTKPILVGWCETNIGYMAVFECPECGQRFRFHCTIGTWIADIDEFDHYLYYYAKMCANIDEINKKLENDTEDIDEVLRREVPKGLLSYRQFDKVSVMKKHEAIKEINRLTGIGLKLSAFYYDEYIKE